MDDTAPSTPPRQFKIRHWWLGHGQVVDGALDQERGRPRAKIRKARGGGKLTERVKKETHQPHPPLLDPSWKHEHGGQLDQDHQWDGHHSLGHHQPPRADVKEHAPEDGMHDDVEVEEDKGGQVETGRQIVKRASFSSCRRSLQRLRWRRSSSCSIRSDDAVTDHSSPVLTSATSNMPSTAHAAHRISTSTTASTTTTSFNRNSTSTTFSYSTCTTTFSSTSTLPFNPTTACSSTHPAPPDFHSSRLSIIIDPPSTASSAGSIPPASCGTVVSMGASDVTEALEVSWAPKPPATSAGSKQSSQIRRDSLAVPRYRPYRSPGRDDHYQNGEHFRGAKRIYKRNSSQSLEQLGLASHSPQESGRTAPNLQNQKSSGLNDSEHEDPDPAWLGAIDYHNFLSVAVNCQTSTTLSANAATQTGTATFGKFADTNGDLAIGDISICSDRPSPKPELAKKRCKLRSKTLTSEPHLPFRDRGNSTLIEKADSGESSRIPRPATHDPSQTIKSKRSFFFRGQAPEMVSDNTFGPHGNKFEALSSKISKSDLTKLVTPKKERRGIPSSSTTPSTCTRSATKTPILKASPTTAAHLDQRAAPTPQPSTLQKLGSLGSLPSSRYRLVKESGQIEGAAPPPKSPATGHPHKQPLSLRTTNLQAERSRPKMSDFGYGGEPQKPWNSSSGPSSGSPSKPSVSSEQRSISSGSFASSAKDAKDSTFKNNRPKLQKKVSKLFGDADERVPRSSDTSIPPKPISSYRPISFISHDSDGVWFSEVFDQVDNATNGTPKIVGNWGASPDLSVLSTQPSASTPSREVFDAFSHKNNQSASNIPPRTIRQVCARKSPKINIGPVVQGLAAKTNNQRPLPQQETGDDAESSAAMREELADQLASRLGLSDSAARAQILTAFTELAAPSLHEHPAIRGDLALQMDVGLLEDRAIEPTASSTVIATALPNTTPSPAITVHVPSLDASRQDTARSAGTAKKTAQFSAKAVPMPSDLTARCLVPAHNIAKNLTTPMPEDPNPGFDRTTDVTWYRYTHLLSNHKRRVHQPKLERIFGPVTTMFVLNHGRGVENWAKFGQPQYNGRFRYFDLDGAIRFRIMQILLKDYLPSKYILLNGRSQAAPAWPLNEFASLWDILGPLQNYLTASPLLRADVMTAILMMQPFHVIFSPFVKPDTQPLPTKWLFRYAQYMQNIRVEVDMTKLGFGPTWDATLMSTKLRDIGNLVWVFAEEMEKRDPVTNPLGLLTICCRRYFGYRQGKNPFQGNGEVYHYPLIGGEEDGQDSKADKCLPRYYGRSSTILPPSVHHPYSKHRTHHSYSPTSVPFVHEGHMSVFHPLRRLQGRVWIVRMVGLSEKWVRDWHWAWWPKEEFDAIPDEKRMDHIDRCTPTEFTYASHNHTVFVDAGVCHGIQRVPALPEKTKHSCLYDKENDVFLENGTANVMTIMENGVEMVPRVKNRSMPRFELSGSGNPNDPFELMEEAIILPSPHRLKTIASYGAIRHNNTNRTDTNGCRKLTHTKAAKVLGVTLPENGQFTTNTCPITSSSPKAAKILGVVSPILHEFPTRFANATTPSSSASTPEDTEDEYSIKPRHSTQSRAPSRSSICSPVPNSQLSHPITGGPGSEYHSSEQTSRASSVSGRRPRALTNKRSIMSLLSRDSKKANKVNVIK